MPKSKHSGEIYTLAYSNMVVDKLRESVEVKTRIRVYSKFCCGLGKKSADFVSCFTGRDAVTAIVELDLAKTREEATLIGDLVLANGKLVLVGNFPSSLSLEDCPKCILRFKEDHDRLPERLKHSKSKQELRHSLSRISLSTNSFRNLSLKDFLKRGRVASGSRFLNENLSHCNDDMIVKFRDMFKRSWTKECVLLGSGTKDSLRDFLRNELNLRLQEDVFETVFQHMDVNKDGLVDQTEFAVGMCMLSKEGAGKSDADLLFSLFDTDADESLSKTEFATMILSIVGTDLSSFFSISGAKSSFAEFLESEYNGELLEFCDEVKELVGTESEKSVTVEDASKIFNTFIKEDAPKQINISHAQRKEFEKILKDAEKSAANVPSTIFDNPLAESLYVLKTDPFPRYKARLRQGESDPFINGIWMKARLKQGDQMNRETFKQWEKQTPELFSFLQKLQSACLDAVKKS
mmetsp:Transcript_7450/g.8561  ORF Transcript_7450/g.8561 Transcript_7450/m.8561 type:complete len:464 (-) Transcript_7450:756-2147(-)|eukprot:CAMPEP_0184019716 /NCGR_PEP_ID=MMETSP0954-20121128/8919_1 /TAXON_ID=627963 /ORGANISM="Aplanochytrium sp, Strain PBS07" /LENGTH=463 /DNA_ID=CAMNT_0026301439 /DNA_START=242 /DNA_END=1633 /DNA_ORIENTATION=+